MQLVLLFSTKPVGKEIFLEVSSPLNNINFKGDITEFGPNHSLVSIGCMW